MKKEQAIEILSNLNWSAGSVDRDRIIEAISLAIRALNEIPPKNINSCYEDDSVYCEECPHHRSTSWCALAIPHHGPVSELYKIRMEGFWEGIHCAEDEYNSLIEIIEEYDKELEELQKGESNDK